MEKMGKSSYKCDDVLISKHGRRRTLINNVSQLNPSSPAECSSSKHETHIIKSNVSLHILALTKATRKSSFLNQFNKEFIN